MRKPKKVNWKKEIEEIKRHATFKGVKGRTNDEIGSIVGCDGSTISRLCHGSTNEPYYSTGRAILLLKISVCS